MNPAKVVVHVMERHRMLQIVQLFAECVGQSRKSAHRHSHRQILALDVARGNVAIIRVATDYRLASTHADCGAVAGFRRVLWRAINLLKLRVINLASKSILNCKQISSMPVGRKLNAIDEPRF